MEATNSERCRKYRLHTGHISICFKEKELDLMNTIETNALRANLSKAEYCKRMLAFALDMVQNHRYEKN